MNQRIHAQDTHRTHRKLPQGLGRAHQQCVPASRAAQKGEEEASAACFSAFAEEMDTHIEGAKYERQLCDEKIKSIW